MLYTGCCSCVVALSPRSDINLYIRAHEILTGLFPPVLDTFDGAFVTVTAFVAPLTAGSPMTHWRMSGPVRQDFCLCGTPSMVHLTHFLFCYTCGKFQSWLDLLLVLL
jgi:hypothetical protein